MKVYQTKMFVSLPKPRLMTVYQTIIYDNLPSPLAKLSEVAHVDWANTYVPKIPTHWQHLLLCSDILVQGSQVLLKHFKLIRVNWSQHTRFYYDFHRRAVNAHTKLCRP